MALPGGLTLDFAPHLVVVVVIFLLLFFLRDYNLLSVEQTGEPCKSG